MEGKEEEKYIYQVLDNLKEKEKKLKLKKKERKKVEFQTEGGVG